MKRRDAEIERWLAAEATGDEARAESALAAALARMPRLAPPAGFAERVLAAAPIGVRRAAFVGSWRWALGAALALTGVAAWLLPALRWVPFGAPRFADVVKAWAVGTGAVMETIQAGLVVGAFLVQLARWAAVAIQAPEIAAGLAGSAIVGAAALYALNHLLALERRSW